MTATVLDGGGGKVVRFRLQLRDETPENWWCGVEAKLLILGGRIDHHLDP